MFYQLKDDFSHCTLFSKLKDAFSQLKDALSRCAIVFDNPFYTIRTSTYLAYLRQIRYIAENESRPLDNPKYRKFLLSRLFLYLSFIMCILRLLALVRLQIRGHSLRENTSIDPLLTTLVLTNSFFNYLTLGSLALLFLFFLHLDYSTSFSFDSYLSTLFYNTVSSGNGFFTINPHLQLPRELSVKQPTESYLQLRAWYKGMLNPRPSPTFAHSKCPVTHVSPRVRTRLVLQCTLYEGLFASLNLATVSGILLFAVRFLFIFYQKLSPTLFIVAIFDAFLQTSLALHTLTNVCFGLHALFVLRSLTRAHIQEMNTSLMWLLVKLRYLKNHHCYQLLLQRQLTFFYREHRFLQYFQQYLNAKVLSGFSLATFLTNLLLQMILLNLFLRSQLNVFEMVLISVFLCFQMFCMLIACQVAITWTDALYSSARYLFRAQFLLRRPANALNYPRHLSVKLHLMRNFELLCTKKKARFTIGPLANISTSALFQFFFAYSGFFMYISMLMADLHLY